MKREIGMVEEFFKKNGFPRGLVLHKMTNDLDAVKILTECLHMHLFVKDLLAGCADVPKLRVGLLLEEASEFAEAIAKGDKVALADAIADVIYVAVGTAITFNIPLDKIFDEVHRSNMTKKSKGDGDLLLKGTSAKSGEYSAPDIARILREQS
jgi:hypothetical protein